MATHYEILDLDSNASSEQIKAAWRKQARRYHPDMKGGDRERFEQAQEAYEVLHQPELRMAYDLSLAAQARFRLITPSVETICQTTYYSPTHLSPPQLFALRKFRQTVLWEMDPDEDLAEPEEIILEDIEPGQPLLHSLLNSTRGRRHGIEWLQARATTREFVIENFLSLGSNINEALQACTTLLGDAVPNREGWLFGQTLLVQDCNLCLFPDDDDVCYVQLWQALLRAFGSRGLKAPNPTSRMGTIIAIHKAVSDGHRIGRLLDLFEHQIGLSRLETILKALAEPNPQEHSE